MVLEAKGGAVPCHLITLSGNDMKEKGGRILSLASQWLYVC